MAALLVFTNNRFISAEEVIKSIPVEIQEKIGITRPFYENINIIKEPSSILVLCNKYNKLESTYVPEDLVDIGGGQKLKKEAKEALYVMREDMAKEGHKITVRSTYRSYDRQNTIHKQYIKANGQAQTDTFSARPGHSEHQTGLAIDLVQAGNNSSSLSGAKFEKTKQYQWMIENAYKYGFILRYPKEYEKVTGYKYEPWHWRYVGVEVSTFMRENNIATFDEYVAMYVITDIA